MAKKSTAKKNTTTKRAAASSSKASKTKASKAAKPTASAKKIAPARNSRKQSGAAGKTKPKAVTAAATAGSKKRSKAKGSTGRSRKQAVSVAVLKGYDKVGGDEALRGDAPSEAQLRKIKSGLTRKELNRYRDLLLKKRAEILGDVASLEMDAQNGSGGGISYEHMADAGSDNFEQEFTLGLVESERKLLAEITDALLRMTSGIYGVCVERGVPIGKTRLDAKPWAKWCIEVVREKETKGLS